jgi:hypothetical protein
MVGHEMYFLMDGYSNYNQVKMVKKDKEKNIHFKMHIMLCFLGYVMPLSLSKK